MKNNQETPPYVKALQITFFLATLWVLQFLIMIQWGTSYNFGDGPMFMGTSIIEFVLQGTGGEEIGAYALFIILTRYLLSFGIVWPFLTILFSRSTAKKEEVSKPSETSEE